MGFVVILMLVRIRRFIHCLLEESRFLRVSRHLAQDHMHGRHDAAMLLMMCGALMMTSPRLSPLMVAHETPTGASAGHPGRQLHTWMPLGERGHRTAPRERASGDEEPRGACAPSSVTASP